MKQPFHNPRFSKNLLKGQSTAASPWAIGASALGSCLRASNPSISYRLSIWLICVQDVLFIPHLGKQLASHCAKF
jgi:hypothetical protein